jgi:hypothetical protein
MTFFLVIYDSSMFLVILLDLKDRKKVFSGSRKKFDVVPTSQLSAGDKVTPGVRPLIYFWTQGETEPQGWNIWEFFTLGRDYLVYDIV